MIMFNFLNFQCFYRQIENSSINNYNSSLTINQLYSFHSTWSFLWRIKRTQLIPSMNLRSKLSIWLFLYFNFSQSKISFHVCRWIFEFKKNIFLFTKNVQFYPCFMIKLVALVLCPVHLGAVVELSLFTNELVQKCHDFTHKKKIPK